MILYQWPDFQASRHRGLRILPAASVESSQRLARSQGVHEPDAGADGGSVNPKGMCGFLVVKQE